MMMPSTISYNSVSYSCLLSRKNKSLNFRQSPFIPNRFSGNKLNIPFRQHSKVYAYIYLTKYRSDLAYRVHNNDSFKEFLDYLSQTLGTIVLNHALADFNA